MAFIQHHYMDEGLNRETVAAACNCSIRKLTRAFEGRSVTLNTAVRTLRLHKARELLRRIQQGRKPVPEFRYEIEAAEWLFDQASAKFDHLKDDRH